MPLISVIALPYDSGHRAVRMGCGPLHFIEQGLEGTLRSQGHATGVQNIEAKEGFQTEVGTSFALYHQLANRVEAAYERGAFPLILSGNCGAALGVVAGCGKGAINRALTTTSLGVIWFDAHGDFNTPETTESGFLDGMALAILVGRCWRVLAGTIPGFTPIPEAHIIHVGARDLDTEEKRALDQSQVSAVDADSIERQGLQVALYPALTALRERVSQIYLHLDLDVLDPNEARANGYATEGGLSIAQVSEAIGMIKATFTVTAATISAYDPSCDPDNRTLQAGLQFANHILPHPR